MVQWLRLHVSTAAGTGSIPGPGIRIPRAARSMGKKLKKKKKKKLRESYKCLDVEGKNPMFRKRRLRKKRE